MVEREIPVFCYWNGSIKEGPDGPYYEGSTLRAIRVKRKTKFAKLLDELCRVTGFDKQRFQLDLICRYPSLVQQTKVKYIRLPVVDDSSVQTMLEIPTLHPSISNVELYLEAKLASNEGVDPVVNNGRASMRNCNSSGKRSTAQSSCREEAVSIDLSVIQQSVEAERDNVFGDTLVSCGLLDIGDDDEENYRIGGDTDDDVGDEHVSLFGSPDIEANLLREHASTEKTTDGPDSGLVLANSVNASDSKLSSEAMAWKVDRDLREGRIFHDKDELKQIIKIYSIRRHREYTVEEATKDVWMIKCKRHESGCRWRLRAVKRKRHGLFEITKYNGPHTCAPTESDQGLRQLDVRFLGNEIESLIKTEPSISIADLMQRVKEKFGHTISYNKMWYAKQKVIAKLFGDWDKTFQSLPKFMAALHKSNGTIVEWQINHGPDSNAAIFDRVFWAFRQSIEGFTHCRPLISIDAIDLTGKYKGKMMIATGIDANDQLFPLAFAIAEKESSDSWRWFLSCIRQQVTQRQGICLISNPHPDVLAAIQEPGSQWQEPWAYHRFCLRHICLKFDGKFHNKQLKEFVYKAGNTHNQAEFDSIMNDIAKSNPEARQWLDQLPLIQWTLVYDGGWRYGIMTTNLLEMFGTMLKGSSDLPVMTIVQLTFKRLKTLFEVRRVTANESLSKGEIYAPCVMTKLQEYMTEANTYSVIPLDHIRGVFEVITPASHGQYMQGGGDKHIVQLNQGTCNCGKWQTYKFPCSHVLAVCGRLGLNSWQYIDEHYTTERYSRTWAGQFSPLPKEADWPESDIPRLFPHPSCKPSGKGRPLSTRRRNDRDDFRSGTTIKHCSLCGQEGHVRRTCAQKRKRKR